jgi:Rhodopirellula transposase DDE domain
MDQKAAEYIIGLLVAPTGKQVSLSFSPKDLAQEQIADIRLAASRMSGFQRRGFMAEMSLKYCDGSPRLTETVFGWSRDAVETGLGEKRTGILCIGFQSSRCGNKPWEEKHPGMAEFLCKIAEDQSQQDPTFQSSIAFTRLTAQSALNALVEAGFSGSDLPSLSSMAEILNRLGYRLRKVVKAKPLKKIEETDAIFENIKKKTRKPKIKRTILQD